MPTERYYATTDDEIIKILKEHQNELKTIVPYDSLIDMIEDDYKHSDVCMTELIRTTWIDKVDLEDISVLLHYAGEENQLGQFTPNEEKDTEITWDSVFNRIEELCGDYFSYSFEGLRGDRLSITININECSADTISSLIRSFAQVRPVVFSDNNAIITFLNVIDMKQSDIKIIYEAFDKWVRSVGLD